MSETYTARNQRKYEEAVDAQQLAIDTRQNTLKSLKKQGEEKMNELIGDSNFLDVDYDKIKKLERNTENINNQDEMEEDNAWNEGLTKVIMDKGRPEMRKLYTTWKKEEEEAIKSFNEQFSALQKWRPYGVGWKRHDADAWGYIKMSRSGENHFVNGDDWKKENEKLVGLLKSAKYIPESVDREKEFSDFYRVGFPYYPPRWKGSKGKIKEWEDYILKCKTNKFGCKDREKLMKAWIEASNRLKEKVEKRRKKKEEFIEQKKKDYGIKWPVAFFERPDGNVTKGDIMKWLRYKKKIKKGGRKRTRRKKRRRKSTKKKRRRKRKRTKKKRRRRRR